MATRSALKLLATSLALGLLVGCAATQQVHEINRQGVPVVQNRFETGAYPQRSESSFRVDGGFYAARTPISSTPINEKLRLPESFFKNANMNVQTPTSLTELSARLSRLSGYQVQIDQDVLHSGSSSSSGVASVPSMSTSDPSSPPSSLPPLPSGTTFAATPVSVGNDLMLNEVIFNGNLAGLLDAVTAKLNLSWRWTGDRVEIFRYETKMFRLNALAGQTDVSANLDTTSSSLTGGGGGSSAGGSGSSSGSSGRGSSSSSGGGGNNGSSGQTTSMSSSMEIWKEVEAAVKSVMSSDGKLSMTPSSGTLTVRDTPVALRQVEAQIAEFNRIYGRQVTLNVEVYSVERAAGDTAAVDWNLVWGTAASRYDVNIGSTGGAAGSPTAFTLGVKNGPFAGSGLVASVLSTVGKTTLLTSVPVTTLNGQTVPVNISRDRAYVASYSTTVNTGTGTSGRGTTSTTITPGVVSEGFSMNVMPRILEDNNVIIRYAVDLATIEGITTFTSPDGTSSIQLPQRAVRNFLQNVKVKSGQTMVLTGFQQVTGQENGAGPGSPGAWFLGGSRQANAASRTLVIVITPYVLKD